MRRRLLIVGLVLGCGPQAGPPASAEGGAAEQRDGAPTGREQVLRRDPLLERARASMHGGRVPAPVRAELAASRSGDHRHAARLLQAVAGRPVDPVISRVAARSAPLGPAESLPGPARIAAAPVVDSSVGRAGAAPGRASPDTAGAGSPGSGDGSARPSSSLANRPGPPRGGPPRGSDSSAQPFADPFAGPFADPLAEPGEEPVPELIDDSFAADPTRDPRLTAGLLAAPLLIEHPPPPAPLPPGVPLAILTSLELRRLDDPGSLALEISGARPFAAVAHPLSAQRLRLAIDAAGAVPGFLSARPRVDELAVVCVRRRGTRIEIELEFVADTALVRATPRANGVTLEFRAPAPRAAAAP